ncbi:MAG: type II toxin-antitoxin system Phd/YefM family antitoxin [Sphingomonadales bacterium]|jgi:antitoxin YefM
MMQVSYTDLRRNLAGFLDRANADGTPILVTRKGKEPVVIVAASEFAGWVETAHLLSNPRNAEELLASIADANAGKFVEHDLQF